MQQNPSIEWYEALSYLPACELLELGLQRFGRQLGTNSVLWLYPQSWYNQLPDGLPIVTVMFENKIFVKGKSSNDGRTGVLSYGFLSKLP